MSTADMRTAHLLVYRLYDGDATSQHTFMLARLLQQHGMQVSIVSQEPIGTGVVHAIGQVPADIRPLACTAHYADYASDADLTILQYPIWYPLAERFRTAPGVRVFWYHGVTPPELWTAAGERDILRMAQTRTDLAQHAHLAVAASPFTAAELQQNAGLMPEQVRVVPLGIDVKRFASPPAHETLAALRRKWNLLEPVPQTVGRATKNRRVLLFVGRVAGNKRVDLLIDGLAALAGGAKAEFDDVTLLVVGDTRDGIATQDLVHALKRRAQEAGIGDRVVFTGRVQEIEPYYHLADVYVQSSEHEGFGAPLVEAMAAGTPVIASHSAAMPWVLGVDEDGEGGAGLTFAPGDVGDLARQLRRCLLDRHLAQSLVDAGRLRARAFDVGQFEARAWGVLMDAHAKAQAAEDRQPIASDNGLLAQADVMPRDYRVTSALPLIGRWVARLRAQSTVHIKEAYLDRILERQVNFNRLLARQIGALQAEVAAMESGSRILPERSGESNGRVTDKSQPSTPHADRHL